MQILQPKFMENREWWDYTEDENAKTPYVLTDKAPQEAIDSYENYLNQFVKEAGDGE